MIDISTLLFESLPSTPAAAVGNCAQLASVHWNNCQQFYGASRVYFCPFTDLIISFVEWKRCFPLLTLILIDLQGETFLKTKWKWHANGYVNITQAKVRAFRRLLRRKLITSCTHGWVTSLHRPKRNNQEEKMLDACDVWLLSALGFSTDIGQSKHNSHTCRLDRFSGIWGRCSKVESFHIDQ